MGGSSGCKKERGGQGIQPPLVCLPLVRPFFLVPKYFQAPTAMQATNEPVVLVMTMGILKTLYVVACVQIQSRCPFLIKTLSKKVWLVS